MTTSGSGQSGGSVTLDQFIALNDELAALVRAGVPLESGLIEAGRDLRGRLGEVSGKLGERLSGGMTLPEALSASGSGMPDVYRAVVEAGVRSGRLSKALEGMAAIARGYSEARRAVGIALLYPLIVLGLAYCLALLFLIQIAPRFVSAFEALGLPTIRPLAILSRIGETAPYWAAIPPALVGLLALRWAWTGRSVVLDTSPLGPALNRLPMIGSMIGSFRAANFADLLSLLVDHRVPLDEGVRLAADASGDRAFREEALRLAESIRQGEGPDDAATAGPGAFPPLLSWMLTAGHRQGNLAISLRHLAETYRRKARNRAEFLRSILPTTLMLAIGAGAVLLYALLLFIPLTTLWDEMALPVNQ